MGQLVNLLSERIHEDLPSNIKTKPMEKVNDTTLRGDRELEEPMKKVRQEVMKETVEPQKGEESFDVIPKVKADQEIKTYKSRIPFPARLVQHELDKQFYEFLDVFKKLHINIPFAYVITQMPSYAKFLKKILKNKRKLEDFETVRLNEECSTILLNKLALKLKDSGSFSIPCTIGSINFEKVLCDLSASINLMSFSILQKLGLKEPTPFNVILELTDKSITYPRGILEDVLVKIDKFIFLVDFVVLDIEEDYMVPLILGKPFLTIVRALIDV